MLNAAIVGLGWWGRVLVDAVQGKSEKITVTAGATRTRSKAEDYAKEKGFNLLDKYEDVLADSGVDAVILATPHSQHVSQIIAAAEAGKHVFVEKPLALTKASAEEAIGAVQKAGLTLGVGHNRRFHPAMAELRNRVRNGDLGTILHCETTMTAPAGLFLPPEAWRANSEETPAGGMTPMGIHQIDAMINVLGPIEEAFCVSVRRAVPNDTDDTTSVLFRLKDGSTGYLGTMLATAVGFRFQVFGDKGWAEIRNPTLGHFEFVPNAQGPMTGQHKTTEPETIDFPAFDVVKAGLEAFADAAQGGPAFPVPADEIVHGIAVLEAVIKSAASGKAERVP